MTLEQHQQHSGQSAPLKKQDNSRDSKQLLLPFAYQPLPVQFGYQFPSNQGNLADVKSAFNPAAAALLLPPQPFHFLYHGLPHQPSSVGNMGSDSHIGSLLKRVLFESHPLRKTLDPSMFLTHSIDRKVDELTFQEKMDVLSEYYSIVGQDGGVKKPLSTFANQYDGRNGGTFDLFRSSNKGMI